MNLPIAWLPDLLRALHSFITWMENHGAAAPWLFLGLFLAASGLMIWRLEAMSDDGMEGTVLGTLVMPYCSGVGNLVFAFVLGRDHGPGGEVMINALVNNVTNMTLLIGLPTLFWGMRVSAPGKAGASKAAKGKKEKTHKLNRLSLLLTLTAVLFFAGAVWALARDGTLNFDDGLVLVGLFLFWQCFHVFEVLKSNVRENKSLSWMLPVDLVLLAIGAVAVYISTDWLVSWASRPDHQFKQYLGWLSGWLMVLPNALLALYYGWRGRPEVVYSSQVGDGHVCIPLCIGIYALFHPLSVPAFFQFGMLMLAGATVVHAVFVAAFGKLPRIMGLGLIIAYMVFLAKGLPR
jgi:cation:H+ antiporter